MSKKVFFGLLWVLVLAFGFAQADDFKGTPPKGDVDVSALVGAAPVGGTVGLGLEVLASRKLLSQGFAPEINNQVAIELGVGPVFQAAGTSFLYSLNLRWDFHKDENWTFFGLGGLGGLATCKGCDPSLVVWPHAGVGVIRNINEVVGIRCEVSGQMIAIGARVILF
jgi:hypothetical protein